MTPAERGRIIKEARISKKMTQSEVVGDFITRNMLSQIESGSATPSVKTLEYLANVLDIPVASLMPQGDDTENSSYVSGSERFIRAKMLFCEGRYAEAAELAENEEEWGAFADEFTVLSAKCFYRLAETFAESDAAKAVEYARRAAELSEKGSYASVQLKNNSLKLLNSLAGKLSRYYADLISEI